ncbi:MAG: HAD-IA family hydrolase [Thermoanaerobaculia bacterium]|nr:HAD-IA family hydrolase [Thermoanaerobaculia bacterium]
MSLEQDSKPWNRPIRAVSFDATHTLFHSPRRVQIYLEVLRRHHGNAAVRAADLDRLLPMVWKEFECSVAPPADRFTHHSYPGHPDGSKGFWSRYAERLCEYLELEPSPFAAAELFDRFAQAEAWEVYPDVVRTLSELRRRGLKLAVVSNWDERLPSLLEKLGLAGYFETVVCSAECGVEKPNGAIFRICLDRLDVAPEQALHVGDSELEDVEGARAAGLKALRIDRQCGAEAHLLDLLHPILAPYRSSHSARSGESNLFYLDREGSRVRS